MDVKISNNLFISYLISCMACQTRTIRNIFASVHLLDIQKSYKYFEIKSDNIFSTLEIMAQTEMPSSRCVFRKA